MPPKGISPLDDPPPASSPQESEVELSEEGSDSGSESESESAESPKGTPAAPTPPSAVAKKTANSKQQANLKSKQPRSKAAPPVPTSGSKRPSETTVPKDSKRRKKKGSEPEEPKKVGQETRPLFQRIWGDDDEIATLEGMIAYTAQKGESPVKNMNAFYDFIKKSLKVNVNKKQLKNKVRRFKKRYATCVRKGDTYKPVKAHDAKIFDLLMKLWGGGEGSIGSGLSEQPKPNGKAHKVVNSKKNPAIFKAHVSEPSEMDFDKAFADMGFPESLMKEGMKLMPAEKRAQLNAEWMKFHVAELELLGRRSLLISKQTSLVLEAGKSADD